MRKSTQVLAAITVAGLAITGSTAFTGTGLTNSAGESQFIGGTVTQSVTGAVLDNVVYQFSDDSHTQITGVQLHFADAASNGKQVGIAFTGGNLADFVCTAIDDTQSASCVANTTGVNEVGATSVAISVFESNP